MAAGGMLQSLQGFLFDLPDALFCKLVAVTDLLERHGAFSIQSETVLDDIRFLVAKAIVYGLLTVIVLAFYTFIIFIIGLYFYEAQITHVNLFITLSLTLLIAFTIGFIKKGLEKITNRAILKDKLIQNQRLYTICPLN